MISNPRDRNSILLIILMPSCCNTALRFLVTAVPRWTVLPCKLQNVFMMNRRAIRFYFYNTKLYLNHILLIIAAIVMTSCLEKLVRSCIFYTSSRVKSFCLWLPLHSWQFRDGLPILRIYRDLITSNLQYTWIVYLHLIDFSMCYGFDKSYLGAGQKYYLLFLLNMN